MVHVKAFVLPQPYRRYTLHYVHMIIIKQDFWTDEVPRWESLDFKTLKEAKEYLSIAGDKAYITDNVRGCKIE